MPASSFPYSSARFWPLVLTGSAVVLLAGLAFGVVALSAAPSVALRAAPGEPVTLGDDVDGDAAVFVAPADLAGSAVTCTFGELSRSGSAVPPVLPDTIDVDGVEHVEALPVSEAFAGREMTCTGDGLASVAVATSPGRQALVFSVALVVGSLFIAGTALVMRVVARASDPRRR
ncbi:hypothetical protein KC207_05015 [Phycicoccus sp. BSK3Z-2]|uniref:Uncharacterized protein n=1 Tax=Phycicoccus avicenniae TaxID=2828860 RepID=A0A941DA39_9MICO|nr:hypothetical protein [Phycicoccus avicenniae]MBR7742647.1 hypothetical protein [Phycicoccus avicenniae]